jgi:hypothetical protein
VKAQNSLPSGTPFTQIVALPSCRRDRVAAVDDLHVEGEHRSPEASHPGRLGGVDAEVLEGHGGHGAGA